MFLKSHFSFLSISWLVGGARSFLYGLGNFKSRKKIYLTAGFLRRKRVYNVFNFSSVRIVDYGYNVKSRIHI